MILFQENFQNGLSRWAGKGGGAHHGMVVPDPLGSKNNALVFTETNFCADLVGPVMQSSSNNYILSFDYLGKPMDNTIKENLGCVIGIGNLDCITKVYAAAIPYNLMHGGNNPAYVVLTDDSSWHHYTIPFSATGGSIRLVLEDWTFNGQIPARAGDCYFKNISITDDVIAAPTPTPMPMPVPVQTTMIQGWPDSLRCGTETHPGAILMLHYADNGGAWYKQVYSEEDRHVIFNSDGTYRLSAGDAGSVNGCLHKSISQLYKEGRAFNFVTSKLADNAQPQVDTSSQYDAIMHRLSELEKKNHELNEKLTRYEELFYHGIFYSSVIASSLVVGAKLGSVAKLGSTMFQGAAIGVPLGTAACVLMHKYGITDQVMKLIGDDNLVGV